MKCRTDLRAGTACERLQDKTGRFAVHFLIVFLADENIFTAIYMANQTIGGGDIVQRSKRINDRGLHIAVDDAARFKLRHQLAFRRIFGPGDRATLTEIVRARRKADTVKGLLFLPTSFLI